MFTDNTPQPLTLQDRSFRNQLDSMLMLLGMLVTTIQTLQAQCSQNGTLDENATQEVFGVLQIAMSSQEHARTLLDSSAAAASAPIPETRSPVVPVGEPLDFQSQVVEAVAAKLDAFAQKHHYDTIVSACTYAGSPVPQFAADAKHALAVRSEVWAALYTLWADVQAGTKTMPPTVDAVLALLPPIYWDSTATPEPIATPQPVATPEPVVSTAEAAPVAAPAVST